VDVHKFLGSWSRVLTDVIEDPDVIKSLNIINMYYRYSKCIYPEQEDVFKAFQKCPYDKLSVIILGQDPYTSGEATGLAFANPKDSKSLSPSLRMIKDTIARTIYKGQEFNFDPSLESWAEQGILLLNVALTVESPNPLSHMRHWTDFTEGVLRKLSEVNSGIVYCLWGKSANAYDIYINPYSNTILRYNHPAYAIYQGIPWECDHFIQINNYLKSFNNKTIIW
jgi:uracil-DNA glycosylase